MSIQCMANIFCVRAEQIPFFSCVVAWKISNDPDDTISWKQIGDMLLCEAKIERMNVEL